MNNPSQKSRINNQPLITVDAPESIAPIQFLAIWAGDSLDTFPSLLLPTSSQAKMVELLPLFLPIPGSLLPCFNCTQFPALETIFETS